jgi:hypothetical protein
MIFTKNSALIGVEEPPKEDEILLDQMLLLVSSNDSVTDQLMLNINWETNTMFHSFCLVTSLH